MSYPMHRMMTNLTNGMEYCENDYEMQEVINANTRIGHTNCDYCGKEILAVWDKYNDEKWWPYLGTQAKRPKVYNYSPIIRLMKKSDKCTYVTWENRLMNVHARIHSKNFSLRCMNGSIKLLCNDCFAKTYNRYQIKLDDGSICAISVVEGRGETVESVMDYFHLKGEILGKGGKF